MVNWTFLGFEIEFLKQYIIQLFTLMVQEQI